MQLKKTNKFRVIVDAPMFKKGNITNNTNMVTCEQYPEVFQPLYQFEGVQDYFAFGDTIWRIATKGYDEIAKAVIFSEAHLGGQIRLFPSKELAECFLNEKETKRTEKFSQQSVYQALEYIALFSKVDLEGKTVKEIRDNFEKINNLAKTALENLRDNG